MQGFVPVVRSEVQKSLARAQANPRDAAANGHLGMVLHAHQQHASAEPCYQRASLLAPKSFEWIYYLALVQELQGKNAEAIGNLRRALTLKLDYPAAHLRLADLLLATGDIGESAAIYDRLAKEHPGRALVHYGVGRVKLARGDLTGAIDALKRACDLFPGYGSAHFALAAAYRRAGDPAQADFHATQHSRAKSTAPAREDPLEAQVLALNAGANDQIRLGISLDSAGRLQESAEAHERALQIDATLTQAHINLISLYARLHKPDLAEKHYREAIALNPNLADAHYNYGVLLFGLQRVAEAKSAFNRALEINPGHAEAHTNLGYALINERKLAEAERHFSQAIASKPDHRLAHFHLGRLLVDRQDYRAAIDHFSAILQPEDDQTPGFTYALAATYARAGQRAKALEYARTAHAKAKALGQLDLLTSIERDIKTLERPR